MRYYTLPPNQNRINNNDVNIRISQANFLGKNSKLLVVLGSNPIRSLDYFSEKISL